MNQKVFMLGLLTSLFFALFFFRDLVGSLDKPWGQDPDLYFSYFIQENNLSKLSTLDFHDLFDTRMLYPHKTTLAFGGSMFVQSAIALPIYLVTHNVFISSNLMLLLSFVLSFLAMYWLAFIITKSVRGSIVASLIYTYNPYVLAHFPWHFELLSLELLPLIFLVVEALLKRVRWYYAFALSMLLFLQLASSFYYFLFIGIALPIYVALRIVMESIPVKQFIKLPFVVSGLLFIILAFFYLQPYIEVKNIYAVKRPLKNIQALSAKPTDFIFTSSENSMYGWMVRDRKLQLLRTPDTNQNNGEHSLFAGLVVYILLLIALWLVVLKRFAGKKRKQAIIWFIMLALVVLFAFGPYLSFGSMQIHLPYLLIYKFMPFADGIRAVIRFIVIGYIAMGLIAGLVFDYYARLVKRTIGIGLFVILVMFISLEYRHNFPKSYIIDASILQFYYWLDKDPGSKVIVELPIANNLAISPRDYRDFQDDAKYLLYGLYHNKYILNGYQTFIPPDAYETGNQLTIYFPNRKKLAMLRKIGVDLIVVHNEEYEASFNRGAGKRLIEQLTILGLKKVYSQDSITAFALH